MQSKKGARHHVIKYFILMYKQGSWTKSILAFLDFLVLDFERTWMFFDI